MEMRLPITIAHIWFGYTCSANSRIHTINLIWITSGNYFVEEDKLQMFSKSKNSNSPQYFGSSSLPSRQSLLRKIQKYLALLKHK